MISGEDESSSVLNGRLRPRKSTANIPNPTYKSTYKQENKVAQDKPKRNSTPSKASPNIQDDLNAKADSSHLAQLLCPYCDRKFTTKLSASKHARRIHLSTSKQDNFINCLFCNHSEAVASKIIQHMVDSHPNQYFACLVCNNRFLSTSELAEHKLNVCEKQKQAYRSKLRQKTSSVSSKDQKKIDIDDKNQYSGENKEPKHEPEFNGVVISCELKPSHGSDALDIEDKITTNLILPSNMGNTVLDKNAVIILDDIQWKRRIPPNFTFRNADADQILSRLGVVHRSPRVGESTRRDWLKMIDVNNQKFEKCFDTNFYSRVASNVQQNLSKFLDGSFNFSPDPDKVIKTRKSKCSAVINTAEGFPILLPHEQYSRNRFDGYMPRAIAPKHKWKWDSTENDKNIIIDASVMKRDNHVDNCIITLVSSLDMWTQLRMRRKFEGFFCKSQTERAERQNIIGRELKEILESREIPSTSSQVVKYKDSSTDTSTTTDGEGGSDFPSFLGLSARASRSEEVMQPAVLSGEWVRPRCYVCCACGDQTRDARALTAHMTTNHPNAQVQHYEIVGESLLNADILKHLYVPPSQMPYRTRPLRGFRNCTKCKKSITMEDLHQHMLDCAGDTPTVRRKCRSRPFGVRRRRPRVPDNNTIRKKMRKDLRVRHNQKALLRVRPRIRTEVGDAETIRKMIADLPAKRHRQAAGNHNTLQALRPRRKLDRPRNTFKIKRPKDSKARKVQTNKDKDLAILDEDDQPLKPRSKIEPEKVISNKKRVSSRVTAATNKKKIFAGKDVRTANERQQNTPTKDASTSQPQQLSGETSTQTLNISTRENDSKDNEQAGNSDGKNTPDEERDKDIHNSIAPDPTLLKHSINNITSSTKASEIVQECNLPEQTSDTAISDNQNVFLENEVASSLPEKPPLHSNHKRSSQKKRESLLNCIEKIKNQQKAETMAYYQRYVDRVTQRQFEHAPLPLMDPHPAIISRTHDESGIAKNVVPDMFVGPQGMAGGLYQDFRWGLQSEAQTHYRAPIMAPMGDPYCGYKNPEVPYWKAKIPSGGKRRKSQSVRLSTTHNEQVNQMAPIYYTQHWNYSPYTSMMHAQLQTQWEQSHVIPEMMLLQHQTSEAFENSLTAQYKNQSALAPGQSTFDCNYDVRRDQMRLYNETTPVISTNQQNHNIMAISPPLWVRASVQPNQINNNHTLPGILPSMSFGQVVTPITQRKQHKNVSESSEPDACTSTPSRILEDTLCNTNMQKTFSESTNALDIQNTKESSAYSSNVLRTTPQIETKFTDKNYDSTPITQDEYGSRINKSYDNSSGFSDSRFKPDHYKTTKVHSTVDHQHSISQLLVDESPPKPQSEKKTGDSHISDNVMAECVYYSNLNNKIIHDRYVTEHPQLMTSVPLKSQAPKRTPSPNESDMREYIDLMSTGQSDYLAFNTDKAIYAQKHNNYKDSAREKASEETSNTCTDSGLNEEPLDLSVKHALAIYNDNDESNVYAQKDILYGTLCISKTTRKESNKKTYKERHLNIEDSEQIVEKNATEETVSNLYYKDKQQDATCVIGTNCAVENPGQSSCKRSTVEYYEELRGVPNISHMDSTKTPITFTEQSPNEKEINSKKYPSKSLFTSDMNGIDSYKAGLNTLEELASTNSNYYLEAKGNLLYQTEKSNEKIKSTLEEQSLVEVTETAVINKSNSSYLLHHNTKNLQKNSHDTLKEQEPDTSHLKPKQNIVLKDLISTEPTDLQNEETGADETSEIVCSRSFYDQDIEIRRKASFAEIFTTLVSTSSKERQIRLCKILIKVDFPEDTENYKRLIDFMNKNYDISQAFLTAFSRNLIKHYLRITMNGDVLPSSSILPEKRYGADAKLNLLHAYTKLILTMPAQKNHTTNLVFDIDPENKTPTANPSLDDEKEKKEFFENEVSKHINSIMDAMDLTDEDLDYLESKIFMLIQEPAQNQETSKNLNEQKASLRAVRIKTSLARKSITDDKQTDNQEVYDNQQICIDSQQRDQSITQVVNSECGYKDLPTDNASAQNSGYNDNSFINQSKTRPTIQKKVACETDNIISLVDNNNEKQLNLTFNVSVDKVAMKDQTANTVMPQLPSDNDVKQKDQALPFDKENLIDKYAEKINIEAVTPKIIEYDTLYKSCFDAVCSQNQAVNKIDKLDSSTTPAVSKPDNCMPDSSTLICPEKMRTSFEDDILNQINHIISQVIQITIECSESNDTLALENNLSENITPKRSSIVDEGFDDDDNVSFLYDPEPEEKTSCTTKDELSTATSAPQPLNATVCEDEPVINKLKTDEARNGNENYAGKENHESLYFEHKNDNGTTDNLNKQVESCGLENVGHTLVSNKLPDENNGIPVSQMNSNDDAHFDHSQNCITKDSLNEEILIETKKKPKDMQANIKPTNIYIDKNKTQIECNDIEADQEKTAIQSFTVDEHNSLSDANTFEISNTPRELQSQSGHTCTLSAINHAAKEVTPSQTGQSIVSVDSDMSTCAEELSERALRRSRRGKSMYIDDNEKRAIDQDTLANNEARNKLPVTKKQLIFSKLLLDENIRNKPYDKTDILTETIILPVKHKNISGKHKRKKTKWLPVKYYDGKDTETDSLNLASDNNNINTIQKEVSCLNTSKENHSLDSETAQNNNCNEYEINVTLEKRQLNISLSSNRSDGSKAKIIKITNKKDKTLKHQDAEDLSIKTDVEINVGSIEKVSELSTVKLNDNQLAIPSGYNGLKRQIEKSRGCIETKTACYNRPIFSKQFLCSTSVSEKNPENYDPYDINYEIETETTRPIAKRRISKSITGSYKTSKKCLKYDNTNDKSRYRVEMEKPTIAVSEISPPNVSDSDSSLSDVPLQKFVDAKEKLENGGFKSSNCNIPDAGITLDGKLKDDIYMSELESPSDNKNASENMNEQFDKCSDMITNNSGLSTTLIDETNTTCITPDRLDTTDLNTEINQSVNIIENTIDVTAKKTKNTKKKNHREINSKISNVSIETKQQLTPDKCMENFGFFSVRQPRKSNLLATKKISETFHSMIESDDTYFRFKERHRKTSQSENKKNVDGSHTLKTTPGAMNANSDKKNTLSFEQSAAQDFSSKKHIVSAKATTLEADTPDTATTNSVASTQSIVQQEALTSETVHEPCSANEDDEVDLITAQKMLNSEEIRKLERDLYSGFKEAAEANAGRTTGFNQLRVEEIVPLVMTNQTVSTPINNEVQLETNKKPEKCESPAKLKTAETSRNRRVTDSSDELEDKPLMYPESKVNMFEDKYDIIKRRRDERERAKQAKLAKNAEMAKTPRTSKIEKAKKKSHRKKTRKHTKKPTYQGSQVLTKGALKGFDGIKISIPTQDLNLPPNLSPPHFLQKQGRSKKQNESLLKSRIISGSNYKSYSDIESKKIPDIYEFQDEERPVTKDYRLTRVINKHRSSSSEDEARTVSANRVEKKKKKRKHNGDDIASAEDQQSDSPKIKRWKGKGKGKGKHAHNITNKKTVTSTESVSINHEEKQKREDTEYGIDKISDGSKIDQRMNHLRKLCESAEENDNMLSNVYTALRSIQDSEEPFNDSDVEDQINMPGTSGFVPDRNDESSYESDLSAPTPVLKGPIACTCQIIGDSDDSEIEMGCSHKSCRYKISEAKNAVMGKIFKNNAVRYEKPVSPKLSAEPKPDMNKLFDSLLVPDTTETSSTAKPGLSSTATQTNINAFETAIINVGDGFSGPNHRDRIDELSTYKFGETVKKPSNDISVSQKYFQIENPAQPTAIESSDELKEEEKEPLQSNINQKFKLPKDIKSLKITIPESSLNNSKNMSPRTILLSFKHNHRVRKNKVKHTNRSAPRSDMETTLCEDDLNVAKLRRKKRRANKKHKSHHKRYKESEYEESGKRDGGTKDTALLNRNSTTHIAIDKNETGSELKRKLSPIRKSDEGISTSHDNSADAYDIAPPAELADVPVQRARRKCTVGKQNVLAEHWSSSESEAEVKGRKISTKKSSRAAKKERAGCRSREFDIDTSEAESSDRPPPPKVRARAAAAAIAACDDVSDVERDTSDKKEQELHGWIVGRSHKKLMAMLVCSKSKSRRDDKHKYDDEDDDQEDEAKKNV